MTVRNATTLLVTIFALTSPAAFPAPEPEFIPQVAPGGFTGKHGELLVLYPAKGKISILDETGQFTLVGRYLYDLVRDPKKYEAHLRYVMSSDSGNWEMLVAPAYRGTAMKNYSTVHRLIRNFPKVCELVQNAKELPDDAKRELMSPQWIEGVENAYRDMINEDGLLALGNNTSDMALVFHLLRTGFGAAKLRPEKIYTLPHAQALVRTLLTDPSIQNVSDQWLPASDAYIDGCVKSNQKLGSFDPVLVKDGSVFFTGGLFIGWKGARPSLHGTWDGLAIINTLFKYYPEPDPAKPTSIFHLWAKEPAEKKVQTREALFTLRRRLWLDYKEKRGPSYCTIVGGEPTEDIKQPTEVPTLKDNAGYKQDEMAHWAVLCWEEMFGNPDRNTNDGVQSLLAIVEGKVYKGLKKPTGQQVPGVYDFPPVGRDAEADDSK